MTESEKDRYIEELEIELEDAVNDADRYSGLMNQYEAELDRVRNSNADDEARLSSLIFKNSIAITKTKQLLAEKRGTLLALEERQRELDLEYAGAFGDWGDA